SRPCNGLPDMGETPMLRIVRRLPNPCPLRDTTALLVLMSFFVLTSAGFTFAQNERAVDRALAFLVKAQNTDGSFGATAEVDRRPEITGICLLAFASDGDAPDLGKYGSAVRLATDYLIHCASSPKLSPQSRHVVLFALSQIVGIDDNPRDRVQISQLLRSDSVKEEIPPMEGHISGSWRTLIALLPQSRLGVPDQLSYSLLYRLALGAVAVHCDDLSADINRLLLSRQRRDGSWDGDVRSTAMAVLALTAGDHLLQIPA
ncbi:MAG TPA: hypothetical protein VG722_06640, partial [Tepidisphaeraceae bacterium]|nr:hypothetical protein [Tepidisphaeraceae bacterium]